MRPEYNEAPCRRFRGLWVHLMFSPVSSLSASSIAVLFRSQGGVAEVPASANPGATTATGYTDDVFKAGDAIGKIIEIASSMSSSIGMFTMDGAVRTDNADGTYSYTKVGEGRTISESDYARRDLEATMEKAREPGIEGVRARAYLEAINQGTLQTIDLSRRGVTSTLTRTVMYNQDGSERGSVDRFDTRGLDEFLEANTYVDETGTLRDRESGKYAGIRQNGTVFHYLIF